MVSRLALGEHSSTIGMFIEAHDAGSIIEKWEARNTRFDLAWAALEANGTISRAQAFALASSDLEHLLGVDAHSAVAADHVATVGGDLLSMNSKVVGVISPRGGVVDLF